MVCLISFKVCLPMFHSSANKMFDEIVAYLNDQFINHVRGPIQCNLLKLGSLSPFMLE